MAEHIAYDTDKRIIYVTTAPVDGVVSIDVKEHLYSDIKVDWHNDLNLNKFELPMRSVGGDDLPGSKSLGATFFLNSRWKIRPYEEDHIFRMNGNLFSEDGTSVMIPTLGGYQVLAEMFVSNLTDSTVQQLDEIEQASFEGVVSYDAINGVAGTVFPIGTPTTPSNNLTDTYFIAEDRGLPIIFVNGDITIGDEAVWTNYTWIGQSASKTTITVLTNAEVVGCEFYECHLDGVLDGNSQVERSVIDTLDYIDGYIHKCMINPGTVTLSTNTNSIAHFLDCYSGVPGTGTPEIDMAGDGAGLAIRNYNGGISLKNKTGLSAVSIDLNSGQAILQNTVIAGTIVARGIGKLIDINGDDIPSGSWNGCTIVNETINGPIEVTGGSITEQDKLDIADRVWDEQMSGHTVTGSAGATLSSGMTSGQETVLNTIEELVIELHKLQGLDANHPMTVTTTQRVVDAIVLSITGDGVTTSTVTRQ